MLTKSDKQFIQESIKSAFQDFYENIFEPNASRNEKEHQEMLRILRKHDREIDMLSEYCSDYEKRITKLESRAKS